MLATKCLLLVPVTLCFLLLVLPAQSLQEARALVIIYGTARCKSNPTRIISNATLHLTINATTVATGETTSAGQFLMLAKVTLRDQLMALVSKTAAVVVTAPRQACDVPAAAPADLNGHRILADSSEENPGDLVEDDITRIIQIVDGPNSNDRAVQEIIDALSFEASDLEKDSPFDSIAVYIDQQPEYLDLLHFIDDSGLAVYDFLNTIGDFLGIPPLEVKT